MFKTSFYTNTMNFENTGGNTMCLEVKICCSDPDKSWLKFDLWLCASEDGLGIYEDRPLQYDEPKLLTFFNLCDGSRIDTDPDADLSARQRQLLRNGYDFDFGAFTKIGCALMDLFYSLCNNYFTGFIESVSILDAMKEL